MATTNEIQIVTTKPERRQIARVLEFTPMTAWHINWDSIAKAARELGANFESRWADDGACVVTMFWSYSERD